MYKNNGNQEIEDFPLQEMSFKQKTILILLGILLFFVLLEVGLRLGGFILLSIQEYRNIGSLKQKGAYRIMCLGESTTAGQYPSFLEEIFNQRNIGIKFSVIDKGVPATNTSKILRQLESNIAKYHPDMVIAMMGVNHAGKHLPFEPVTSSKIRDFFKTFHAYKLTRLLWLHMITKAREIGLHGSKNDEPLVKGQLLNHATETYAEFSNDNETEESLKKAIELNPRNIDAYLRLGDIYLDQNNFSQAEEMYKKVISIGPGDFMAYIQLGEVYLRQSRGNEAEELLKKAIELNPQCFELYGKLGWIYYAYFRKFNLAEEMYKKAIELSPQNLAYRRLLTGLYLYQNKYLQAEKLLKKDIKFDSLKDDCAFNALGILYAQSGRLNLAKQYYKKMDELQLEYYDPITRDSYRKLKMLLYKKGIRLVCMQYPMRSIKPLRKIFAEEDGIIFVDNENSFKEAVKKSDYKEYFKDIFAGDFGHCTEKGNRLLAENIANVILRDVFGRRI